MKRLIRSTTGVVHGQWEKYISYHKYPNPNAVARHYCKRCKDEIRYMKYSPIYNYRMVWRPKLCYFNDYFERKEQTND